MKREVRYNYIRYINVSVLNIRYLYLYLCFVCSFQLQAQNDSIGFQLKAYYDAFWNQDDFSLTPVEVYLLNISEQDVNNCSDSTKYYYHYLKGGIYADRERPELELDHLMKAVDLREKTIGILDPEYIELLSELGSISEKLDIDKAIYYYQKAAIIGQTILYNKEIPKYNTTFMQNTYGTVISNLARMYEKKNWNDRVVSMYEYAFKYRSRFYENDDATCFVDLYLLARYYKRQKEYHKVVETYQRAVNYINNSGGYGTNNYVNASYMLATALSLNGQCCKAEKTYESIIKLTLDSLGEDNKNLDFLYSNYCIELANNNSFDKLNLILPQIRQFYFSGKSKPAYVDLLYTISKNLYDKKQYDMADIFIDSLFNYSRYLPDAAMEILYSQKSAIEFVKHNITSAIQWKQRQIDIEKKIGLSDKVYHMSILSELATLYSNNGNYDDALTIYEQVIDGLKEGKFEGNILYEQCVFFVSNLYQLMQKDDAQENFLNSQKVYLEKRSLNDTRVYAHICNLLAVLQMQSNRLKEASKNNILAENIFYKHCGRQSVEYATVLHNKGRILMLQGKNKKALRNFVESRQLQFEINNSVFPNTDKYIKELEK